MDATLTTTLKSTLTNTLTTVVLAHLEPPITAVGGEGGVVRAEAAERSEGPSPPAEFEFPPSSNDHIANDENSRIANDENIQIANVESPMEGDADYADYDKTYDTKPYELHKKRKHCDEDEDEVKVLDLGLNLGLG